MRTALGIVGRWVPILAAIAAGPATAPAPSPAAPRIVNLYNFARNSDDRVPDSERVLFETTRQQVRLIHAANLPATWALQYDALINPKYQDLFKTQLGPADEIAAWWELPRPLVEKAGIKWRGRHDWDSTADVGFSPGYTPDERRRLVDVYMADFRSIFGRYPRTVGSWYIDEVTLAYMADRYGIVASCNCKDQVGTDGYTLWGGYWSGAYYPSRLNAYMPAQTRGGQIDVPIFRMLGSDPIYQYGRVRGMYTLEPVYAGAGGSARWVDWFLGNLTRQPCLAFGYAQAGQENSFGWEAMRAGLTLQVDRLAGLARSGAIRVETLADSGQWFRNRYPLTPPTAVVSLDDWRPAGRRTVWYDSRFYRLNLLWEDGGLRVRDLHLFDQAVPASTHATPLTTRSLACGTLPVMDAAGWAGHGRAGMFPVLLSADGGRASVVVDGTPAVAELNGVALHVSQSLRGGGTLTVTCGEGDLTWRVADGRGRPLRWALDVTGGAGQRAVVRTVRPDGVDYASGGAAYAVRVSAGSCGQADADVIRLLPDATGTLVLTLSTAAAAPGRP